MIKCVRYINVVKSCICICIFNMVWCIMFDYIFKRMILIYFIRCILIVNVYVKRFIFNIMIYDFKKLLRNYYCKKILLMRCEM